MSKTKASDTDATEAYARWTLVREIEDDAYDNDPGPLRSVRIVFSTGEVRDYVAHFISVRKDGTLNLSRVLRLDDPRERTGFEQNVVTVAAGQWQRVESLEAAVA